MKTKHSMGTTILIKVILLGASKMAQQVEDLAAEPPDLSLILGTHMVEESSPPSLEESWRATDPQALVASPRGWSPM